jgi:hypothetical protein
MKIPALRSFGVFAVVLTILGGGIQKASAEVQVDDYLHCGEYSGPNPDVSLTRYLSFDGAKPMWAFSYAVKSPTKVRTEVSCLATGVTPSRDGSVVFSGTDCKVTLTKEVDQTFSVAYSATGEDKTKITGCVFDNPLDQLVSDFNKDLSTTGVASPIEH